MRKVYCKNCKWMEIKRKDAGRNDYYLYRGCSIIGGDNLNNNCRYYKRKWHLFWLKKNYNEKRS